MCVAAKKTRRPTTVPSASAVKNPKGKGAKPGLFDLPDAGDIWDQINFWSGRGDQTRPEMVNQARDITSAVVGTGVQALDAQYTAGLGGSLYNNVLRPETDLTSRTSANWGAFGRDVAVTGATAGAAAASRAKAVERIKSAAKIGTVAVGTAAAGAAASRTRR